MLEWVATEVIKFFPLVLFKEKGDRPYLQLNLSTILHKGTNLHFCPSVLSLVNVGKLLTQRPAQEQPSAEDCLLWEIKEYH